MSVNIQDIYNIAYSVCYSIRSGKASDASTECSAFASCVASSNYQDYNSILNCCNKNVLDPWGTNILLGWIGQLVAPDAMPSPDCPRIATETLYKIQYYLQQIQQGIAPADALASATNNPELESQIQMIDTMNSMMEFMVVLPIIQSMSQMFNRDSNSGLINMISQILPIFLLMMML